MGVPKGRFRVAETAFWQGENGLMPMQNGAEKTMKKAFSEVQKIGFGVRC